MVGPLLFAALLAIVARPRFLAEPRALLLAAFALPSLAMMLRRELVVAGPAELGGAGLCLGERAGGRLGARAGLAALGRRLGGGQYRGRGRRCSAPTDALAAAGIAVPAKYDPLHRLRGWRELGERYRGLLAAHPGLTLLADDRELLAALIYYVRPHPFGAVEWNPIPGITDQYRLINNIGDHRGEDFLAVTVHDLFDEMRPEFAELTPLTTIRRRPDGGTTYAVSIARGYSGDGRRQRRR